MTSLVDIPRMSGMSDLPFETNIHIDDTLLKEDLDKLDRMKIAAREAKARWEDLQGEHDVFEQHVFDRMDAADTLSLKSSRNHYIAKSTTYATITDMDELREWLDDQGLSEEFLKDAPQKARLNELVREYADNGQTLPPGVGSYDRRYISIKHLEDN